MELLERSPRESGHDYALRTLKENIIHLTLEPGSQISENELAAEMGLSRTPVRAALADLAQVNIIEIHPQKKSLVSLIDYAMVEEAQFMRNQLETAVLDVVCERASEQDFIRLQENLRLQNFYLDHFNPQLLMELDDQFHRLLFELAGKPMVYQLMNTISIHFDRVRSMALVSVKDLKIVQDHEAIVEALLQRDAAKAKEIMAVHLNRYKVDAATIRERYPQYVKD